MEQPVKDKEPVKKGTRSWKPAAMLDVRDKAPGFRYRWTDKDRANLDRKQAEGWVYASDLTGAAAEHAHPGKTGDGKPLTTTPEYRELVLMALPEELGEARDRYFNERTDQQERGIKRDLDKNLSREGGERARSYGKVVID